MTLAWMMVLIFLGVGLLLLALMAVLSRKSGPGFGVPSVVCAWTPLPVPDFHPGG